MHEKGHEQKPVVKPEFIHARTELEFKTIGQRPFFYVFSFCSNILPGLNFTLRRGNIGTVSPVRGFRPSRSVCFQRLKHPNPWSMMPLPSFNSSAITVCNASRCSRHSFCGTERRAAILFIRSALLIYPILPGLKKAR